MKSKSNKLYVTGIIIGIYRMVNLPSRFQSTLQFDQRHWSMARWKHSSLFRSADGVYMSRTGIYELTFGINGEIFHDGVVHMSALCTGACDIDVFVGSALIDLSAIAGRSRVHDACAVRSMTVHLRKTLGTV
jgi:hypothetical protein